MLYPKRLGIFVGGKLIIEIECVNLNQSMSYPNHKNKMQGKHSLISDMSDCSLITTNVHLFLKIYNCSAKSIRLDIWGAVSN